MAQLEALVHVIRRDQHDPVPPNSAPTRAVHKGNANDDACPVEKLVSLEFFAHRTPNACPL